MRMKPARLVLWGAALALSGAARADDAGSATAPYDPVQHWEMDYESGILWKFSSDATPLSYTILPQMVTVKSPLVGDIRPFYGGDLVIRNRFSLLLEPIDVGPEHHFFGLAASGIMEWWDKARTRALFFSAGGGIGWLDSKGHQIAGAQGEDFNLNWFAYTGVRILTRKRLSASAGAYFQHISNHGMNSVNPGVNAVGPMLSVGWHF
jgi:lipid A 3-O-deacylase